MQNIVQLLDAKCTQKQASANIAGLYQLSYDKNKNEPERGLEPRTY